MIWRGKRQRLSSLTQNKYSEKFFRCSLFFSNKLSLYLMKVQSKTFIFCMKMKWIKQKASTSTIPKPLFIPLNKASECNSRFVLSKYDRPWNPIMIKDYIYVQIRQSEISFWFRGSVRHWSFHCNRIKAIHPIRFMNFYKSSQALLISKFLKRLSAESLWRDHHWVSEV